MKRTTSELIAEMETIITELKLSLNQGNTPVVVSRTSEKKLSGLTKQIFDLTNEGFFDQPKTIADIQMKLRAEGIIKPITSLMRPLLYLIKNKLLKREKSEKGYYQYQIRQ